MSLGGSGVSFLEGSRYVRVTKNRAPVSEQPTGRGQQPSGQVFLLGG